MNDATITRLNQINQEFYRITADSFDRTRGQPWPGWEILLPHIKTLPTPVSVLDVGCGNGRFGRFLADQIGTDRLVYHGIDSSADLLDRAHESLSDLDATLDQRDIIAQPVTNGEYDLVALFGVLHHIPGNLHRRDFMASLAGRVKVGGFLAFAAWCFYEYERFRRRIVPWMGDLDIEQHDYLLDWRRDVKALRYCHYVDEIEHAALIAATGLTTIVTFRADGHTNDSNRYTLLRREPTP